MSGATVRIRFAKARTKRPRTAEEARQPALTTGPTRLARMLALAHYIERLIEAGELSGYAEAARALGLTRARVTQVMDLMLLAPEIQEKIATGVLARSERGLRRVKTEAEWGAQLNKFACPDARDSGCRDRRLRND